MSKTSQSVVETYIDLIEAGVTDINSTRLALGKKWVYDDIPRLDVRDYPRVSVLCPTASSQPHEIGSTNERFSPRIEVQVRVKKDQTIPISGTGTFKGLQLVDYISKLITDVIRTASSRATMLTNDSVFYSVLEAENTILDDLVIIKQLIFKNTLKR